MAGSTRGLPGYADMPLPVRRSASLILLLKGLGKLPIRDKIVIAVFVSLAAGSLLYLFFTNWITLAAGIIGGIFFLIRLFAGKT